MDATGINRFFLREGKRAVILAEETMIVSPVEGKIAEVQTLRSSKPIHGKQTSILDEYYAFEDIVHSADLQEQFEGGTCINIYLSPFNLHYITSPADFKITKIQYHPNFCRPIVFMKSGEIRNERLVIYGETPAGIPLILILIGSFMVAGLECIIEEGETIKRAELLGGFKLGSTVMLLFPKDTVDMVTPPQTKVLHGEPLAQWKK